MPHVNDQFRGHMFGPDPRACTTAAFGCTWPTVPAFRYRIQSDDASGLWSGWNDGGVLVGQVGAIDDHDTKLWVQLTRFELFELVELRKLPGTTEFDGYRWQLIWKLLVDPLTLLDELPVAMGRCNVNVPLPNWTGGPSFPGSFGLTARMDQVPWNKSEPPE